MKPERELSQREEWQELSGYYQTEIDERLALLEDEIIIANATLEKIDEDEDLERYQDYSQQTIERLDEQWGHNGDIFLVTGNWLEASIAWNDESILVRHNRKEAFTKAKSNGFIVNRVADEDGVEYPRVGMSFIAADLPFRSPLMQGNIDILCFAELYEISLQYLRHASREVVSTTTKDISEAIERATSLLELYTTHEGSAFYRQSASKQQAFLKAIVDSVEQTLPDHSSQDKLVVKNLQVPYVFVNDNFGDGYKPIGAMAEEAPLEITGRVMGVTLTDITPDYRVERYENLDQMDHRLTGLCLIVEPFDKNFDGDEYDDNDLIIPLRQMRAGEFLLG